MISAPHQQHYTSTMSRRLTTSEHRVSPTPSEQSFQTTVTNPVSLFSVSQADGISDSVSLVTTGHDALIWGRHPRAAMPIGYTMVRVQSSAPGQSHSQQQQSDLDLFEFLREAQLEHYYTALTTHLKIRSVQQIKYVEDSDLSELGFSRPEQRRLRKYFKRECPQTTMGKLRKRLSRSTVGRVSIGSKLRDQHLDSELSPYQHHSIRSNNDEDGSEWVDGWNEDRPNGASTRTSRAVCRNGRIGSGDEHGLFTSKSPVYRVIDSDQVELGTSLGEGEFGRVYQGVWRPESGGVIQVAVKILESQGLVENPSDFLNEIAVMHRIDHPDIVHLYGVCIEPDSWKIVTELAPLRSLLECLREPELRSSFPVTTLHRFAVQITRGMSYLEEIGLVHRDLAARNILVFSKEVVKISDFGMSRALHLGKSYYQSNFNVNLKLPTAWCAPECIHDLCFTTASDVWAYAVTLWEMYTYGFTPWAGLTGRQILETIDAPRSGRLDQPDACPDAVYDAVMRACWAHEPKARPSFGQLLGMLPRLCPERWITVREYDPQSDNNSTNESAISSENLECLPHLRTAGVRALGRHLAVESNEVVFVLGKRSSQLWKVITQHTGLVGCVPTAILKPYPANPRDTHVARDSPVIPTASLGKNTEKSTESPVGKSLMRNGRRASLSDLAFRKTVSRLTKLTGSGQHSGNSTTTNARGSRLTADKISLPQNDFRHVGHVGSDGRTFGELGIVGVALGSSEDLARSSPSVTSNTSDSDRNGESRSSSNQENRNLAAPTDVGDIAPSDSNEVKPRGRTLDFNSVKNMLSKGNTPSHPLKEGKSDLSTEDLFSTKLSDKVDEGLGLDFGSSLLDEVFKCFSLNGTSSTTEQKSEDLVDQNKTFTISTPVNTSNSVITSPSVSTVPVDPAQPIHDSKDDSSPVRHSKTDSPGPERVTSKILTDVQPEVTFKPKYADISVAPPCKATASSHDLLSPDADAQGILPCSNTLISTVSKSTHSRSSDSRGTSRRSRTRTRDHPVGTSDDDQDVEVDASGPRSRWKRSTFGSLTRRSLSVSKVPGFSRDYAGQNDSESTDRLRSSKRLTISRPVLITKPIVPGDSSEDPLTLGQIPATSSSTLTSLCPGTIDRASLRSSASRDSSLTIVSAANDYPHCGGEGLDEHSLEVGRDGLMRQSSNRRSSMSPAPSLSSINQPYFRSGLGSGGAVGHLMSGSVAAGPASSGLRALRGGDVVFRAATHSAGSNWTTRRKPLGVAGSSLINNEPRAVGSRLGLTDHPTSFGTSRSPDYLTHTTGSSSLLSRLDGLSTGSGNVQSGHRAVIGDTRQKGLTRSMSTVSSSSSSSSSSPLSPPSLVNSPARITDPTHGSVRLTNTLAQIGRNSDVGGSGNSSLMDNQIASFWGSTFANLLNGSPDTGGGVEEDVTLSETSLRDLNSTLACTTLRPGLSSTLRIGTTRRRLTGNDDDDPVAV